jgi:ATP-dependent Zn protease
MSQQNASLANEWRRLSRAATVVAVLTSPAWFMVFHHTNGWPIWRSAIVTVFAVAAFRGLVDVIAHKLIPRANLYGADEASLEHDVVARRRLWFWRRRFRMIFMAIFWFLLIWGGLVAVLNLFGTSLPLIPDLGGLGSAFGGGNSAQFLILGLQLPLLFFFNFAILFGPLLFFGIKQMKAYEPGDADWGVKLDDVRGQQEPKEEITRVISLWQAGDDFKAAGGKPERGLLFIGAPGTGKTMLSKSIATSFNCPFMTMPGSGFAQTFIGLDVVIVMILVGRARRLARKWGGQCIVFIDEIDAVGMRRAALGGQGAMGAMMPPSLVPDFYGPWGSLTASGDVIVETREWREYVFNQRAEPPAPLYPAPIARVADKINNFMMPGGMMGGGQGMALNQLLVQMDGVDDPPLMRRLGSKLLTTLLDALYVVPQKVGRFRLRPKSPKPRDEQIYFIGATNAPIEALDPALIRPGRMGRHIYFRTPTRDDRADIFDLYLRKVAHEPDIDTEARRNELARITGGYSPAMIEQICSMALTYAHSEGRERFGRADIVEAMTTIETGMAQGVEYVPDELRATALHEAGHAIGSYLFQSNIEATRLTVRKRGSSLGHFQSHEIEERFSSFKSEEMADLVMILAAMATEHVFYGENSVGVGGDVHGATRMALAMVGAAAMGPDYVNLDGRFASEDDEEAERDKIMQRFERVGNRIIHRSDPGAGSPYAASFVGVMNDPYKRTAAAQILGQAYIYAYNAMRHNRNALNRVADVLVEKRELHGDEVIDLLKEVDPQRPNIDLLDAETWPKI